MFEEAGWVNKVITAGIIAMIGWTLMSVQRMSVDLAVLNAQVQSINIQLEKQPSIVDIVTVQQKVERHEQWLGRLSDRVNAVEDRVTAREAEDSALR